MRIATAFARGSSQESSAARFVPLSGVASVSSHQYPGLNPGVSSLSFCAISGVFSLTSTAAAAAPEDAEELEVAEAREQVAATDVEERLREGGGVEELVVEFAVGGVWGAVGRGARPAMKQPESLGGETV